MSFNTCPTLVGGGSMSSAAAVFPASRFGATPPVSDVRKRIAPNRSEIVQLVTGCEQQLRLVQSRLGTPAEQADDAQQARELAHKAKNLRFAIELWEQIMTRAEQPRPAA